MRLGDAVTIDAGGRRAALTPALALVLSATVVAVGRWGPDWPAQEFRAWSAAHHGVTAWTNLWYAGQPLPGYSIVYPAVAGLLGAAWTGLLAVVVGAAAGVRLAPQRGTVVRTGYELSVVFVLCCDLIIGQVPFLLGVACAAWAVVAAKDGRPVPAALLAAGAAVSSPLVGAFVLLTLPALGSALGWRRALPLSAAALGVGAATVLGGAGGPFPYEWLGLVCALAFGVLIFAATPATERAARILGGCYVVAALVAFLVPNPIGGNLARLGQLIALPVAWHLAPRLRMRSPLVIAPLVGLAALWPAWPTISSIGRGADDPSQSQAYYTGLLRFLHRQDPTAGRLEVVFTREHWESYWVAQAFPIARGWERQTDLADNGELYRPLSAGGYRAWLDRNAVSFVALPTAPIDYGGRAEAALLRRPPGYLSRVWHDAHWTVWRVRHPVRLASGPARITRLDTASFTVQFARAGTSIVRIRASDMWAITAGSGCVSETRDGWLRVRAESATTLTVRARVGLSELSDAPRCE